MNRILCLFPHKYIWRSKHLIPTVSDSAEAITIPMSVNYSVNIEEESVCLYV